MEVARKKFYFPNKARRTTRSLLYQLGLPNGTRYEQAEIHLGQLLLTATKEGKTEEIKAINDVRSFFKKQLLRTCQTCGGPTRGISFCGNCRPQDGPQKKFNFEPERERLPRLPRQKAIPYQRKLPKDRKLCPCACGCGEMIFATDKRGRSLRYSYGHQLNVYGFRSRNKAAVGRRTGKRGRPKHEFSTPTSNRPRADWKPHIFHSSIS